jgi:outer membrane protein
MRIVRLTLLPLVLLAAALAATPAAAQTKIAAIRTTVILRDAPQIKAADGKLKGEFAQREKELESEGRKLQEDIKKFQREADTMAAAQRATTEKDLSTRRIDFEAKQRTFTEQAQQRNQELRRDVLEQVNKAIAEVAKERGFDMVVQDPAYASTGIDITEDVMKWLNSAPAAAAPPAKGKKK